MTRPPFSIFWISGNNTMFRVWLGETGETLNVWFTEAIQLFESNNIGWSWWPLKKLGINNPLQIPGNANYDATLNYWNGKRMSFRLLRMFTMD